MRKSSGINCGELIQPPTRERRFRIEIAASCALAVAITLLLNTSAKPQQKESTAPPKQADWPAYGGGPEDIRYSPLKQINRGNVGSLQVAWSYDTGEKGILEMRT